MKKESINPEHKFQNKYRIPSARLPGYDYSRNGAYFVTICTKNREHFFGEIAGGEMRLSDIGEIARICWKQIPDHFPFVVLGKWVVMPNHLHGVVVIDNNVETQNFASLQRRQPQPQQRGKSQRGMETTKTGNQFGPQSQNLASVIRGFKIGVTKYVRWRRDAKSCVSTNTNIADVWQPRFHDRIIRNEDELRRISEYIIANPQNWEKDRYFQKS